MNPIYNIEIIKVDINNLRPTFRGRVIFDDVLHGDTYDGGGVVGPHSDDDWRTDLDI